MLHTRCIEAPPMVLSATIRFGAVAVAMAACSFMYTRLNKARMVVHIGLCCRLCSTQQVRRV
jgi:hypothetical protein